MKDNTQYGSATPKAIASMQTLMDKGVPKRTVPFIMACAAILLEPRIGIAATTMGIVANDLGIHDEILTWMDSVEVGSLLDFLRAGVKEFDPQVPEVNYSFAPPLRDLFALVKQDAPQTEIADTFAKACMYMMMMIATRASK